MARTTVDLGLSGTEGAVPCSSCFELIPDGRRGLLVWVQTVTGDRPVLFCFRCVDVMADIVAGARKQKVAG